MLAASKVAVAKPRTVQAAERSMELALDKMNLGGAQEDEVKNVSDECDDHNRTGVGLVKYVIRLSGNGCLLRFAVSSGNPSLVRSTHGIGCCEWRS